MNDVIHLFLFISFLLEPSLLPGMHGRLCPPFITRALERGKKHGGHSPPYWIPVFTGMTNENVGARLAAPSSLYVLRHSGE